MAVALKKLDRTIMELNPDKSSLLKQFPGFDHEESVQIRNFAGGGGDFLEFYKMCAI